MSSDWTAHFLVPAGAVSNLTSSMVLAVPRSFGLATDVLQDGINAITEDGSGALVFSTYEAGWDHIRREGGLLTLVGTRGDELGLEVMRAHGVLRTSLAQAGDQPFYDEVCLVLSSRDARQEAGAWNLVTKGLLDFGAAIGAEYGWGASDEVVEHMMPLKVHAAVRAGVLPERAFDWSLAPTASSIGQSLLRSCAEEVADCLVMGGYVERRAAAGVSHG